MFHPTMWHPSKYRSSSLGISPYHSSPFISVMQHSPSLPHIQSFLFVYKLSRTESIHRFRDELTGRLLFHSPSYIFSAILLLSILHSFPKPKKNASVTPFVYSFFTPRNSLTQLYHYYFAYFPSLFSFQVTYPHFSYPFL